MSQVTKSLTGHVCFLTAPAVSYSAYETAICQESGKAEKWVSSEAVYKLLRFWKLLRFCLLVNDDWWGRKEYKGLKWIVSTE